MVSAVGGIPFFKWLFLFNLIEFIFLNVLRFVLRFVLRKRPIYAA